MINAPEDPYLIRSLKGHRQSITTLDMHPSCKYIASAGMDNIILLWNLNKKIQPKKLIGHKSQIHDIKFSPNGSLLVSASNDESLKFWDVDFQQSSKQTTLIKAHNARIRGLSFSCDALLLASCGDDKLIKVWSTVDRRLQYTLKKHDNWVRHCQFSPTACNMASCDDKYVHLWDLNKKKPIQTYKEHSGVIHKVKFHSLGNCLASCSHDKKIKLYDLRSQNIIQVYEGHTGPVKTIDFHPNSPFLISSSDDGSTKIWNSKKGQLQYTLQVHSNNTQFSRYGDYFVTGGSDKMINVWKTGFYDSLNEKILENEAVSCSGKSYKPMDIKNTVNNSTQKKQNALKTTGIDFGTNKRQTQKKTNIFYNHTDDNFEIESAQGEEEEERPVKIENPQERQNIIPQSLGKKMRRISNQMQFINKTVQILQARVLNNGEQLNRLVRLLQ